MNRSSVFAVLMALALLFPITANGQGKKGKKGKKDQVTTLETTQQDYQALARLKGVYGRIMTFDANNRKLRLRVEYQIYQPVKKKAKGGKRGAQQAEECAEPQKKKGKKKFNQKKKKKDRQGKNKKGKKGKNKGNNIQQLAREYQQILRIKNPVQRQLRMQQFAARLNTFQQRQLMQYIQAAQKQNQQFKNKFGKNNPKNPNVVAVDVAKEFDLYLARDARVARKDLPLQFDDKGNIKEYTEVEKKKLKDDVLPGYKANVEDLGPGQIVYVYFTKLKKAGDGGKSGGITLPGDPTAKGPVVTGVLIAVDADFLNFGQNRKKKN